MDVKEELFREGLPILKFTEDLFDVKGTELEEYVNEKVKIISEMEVKRGEEYIIWLHIFQEVIQDEAPNGIEKQLELDGKECTDLQKVLVRFATDANFIAMDITQKISYNLLRLEANEEWKFDSEEEIKQWFDDKLNKFVEIGRKEYGDGSSGAEKEMMYEFFEDLKRLSDKYINDMPPEVCFSSFNYKENKIELDQNFPHLNVLSIANERLRDFLYHHKEYSKYDEVLRNAIEILDDKSEDVPTQYIWEKLTNYNSILIVNKIFIEIFERGNKNQKEKEQMILDFAREELFQSIKQMPNVLTRLLMLKVVLKYIQKEKYEENQIELLHEFIEFLRWFNKRYYVFQINVLAKVSLIRWQLIMKQGKKASRQKWIEELEEAYSMDTFRIWLLSLNLDDNIKQRTVETFKNGKVKKKALCKEKITKSDLWEGHALVRYYLEDNKDGIDYLIWDKIVEKLELLRIIKQHIYLEDSSELSEVLLKKGYELAEWLIEELIQQMHNESNDMQSDINEDGRKRKKDMVAFVKQWLLANERNVVFEQNDYDDKLQNKKTLNLLLYHFND